MKNKILNHYEKGFASSPVKVENSEIDFILKHDCSCTDCGTSIFELDDFPQLVETEDELLCEECYREKYMEYCNYCEDLCDLESFDKDYFILNEEAAKETNYIAGVYKVISRPFYFGNILTGFDSFFDNSIKLVFPIKINELKKIECGDMSQEVNSGEICNDCLQKLLRNNRYIKSVPSGSIFLKDHQNWLIENVPHLNLKFSIHRQIHKNINMRGMLEKSNTYKPYDNA